MVMNGYDTDGDGGNNFYTVNGRAFYYAKYPITVSRSQTVRIYLANLTEFDLINSFHLHGDFFRYYPTGSSDHFEYTDTVMLCQGQRGIIEIDFANTGLFMFHAHQSEFTELGWMGYFNVSTDGRRSALAERARGPRAGASGRSSRSCCSSASSRCSRRPAARSLELRRHEPAAAGRVRRPPRRVPARRDPHPGHEPAAGRPDDRLGDRRRRDRPVHARRAGDARPAALEHDRRPVRLGRGRADRGRRHELDRDRDGRRRSRRRSRRPAPSRGAASSATR